MSDDVVGFAGATPSALRTRLTDQALRLARIGAWECELATERLTWTEGVYDIFDFPVGNPLKRSTFVDLYLDASRRDMEAARAQAIRTCSPVRLDTQIRTWRGETRWMRLSIDVACEDGRPVRIFGAKQDVTADREAMERLRRIAENDPLTGLANRTVFDARIRQMTRDGAESCGVSALVIIDLDRFKSLNDAHGHLAGDACLRETAARLRQAFGETALLARLGGDEFVALLRAPLGPARVAKMLSQAATRLARPFVFEGTTLAIGASIGAALVGRPHRRPIGGLFAEADNALYAAKAAGRGTAFIFGEDLSCRPAADIVRGLAA